MTQRQAPEYFQAVQRRTRERWDQLERDPELAGPWRQLFGQVQSPRHVLSELLQNADDAGATHVRVSTARGRFLLEHDGRDFSEEEFSSLCSFGFSNKRTLHTIGFRGVGFKSTFSLGDTVEVLTPSLAVRFHKDRFTEPEWLNDAPPCSLTRFSVTFQDKNRENAFAANLEEWRKSAASLLFFRNIEKLEINDITLRKKDKGDGPVPGSREILLTGKGNPRKVLLFTSTPEPFPNEALVEIREERHTDNIDLPPCRVQLVLGLPEPQRLYVVLPTGVTVGVPFSCNAPFLQDPARGGIKAPSISPTNRWLLHRLGRLAAETMLTWLRKRRLKLDQRAQAYRLLPARPDPWSPDSLGAEATSEVCEQFENALSNTPLLLAAGGRLVDADECIAPPLRTYSIWKPSELLKVFADEENHVLSREVDRKSRQRLESWGRLETLDTDELISRLKTIRPIPRPRSRTKVLELWMIVKNGLNKFKYHTSTAESLALIPVKGKDVLFPASKVVRLPDKAETISMKDWHFLERLLPIADIHGLCSAERGSATSFLELVKLDQPSDVNKVIAMASRKLFGQEKIQINKCVQIAHIMAALDTTTPKDFWWLTRDRYLHPTNHGIIASQDPDLDELLPEEWADEHFLDEAYFDDYAACSRQQWEEWIRTKKSGLLPFVPLEEKTCDWSLSPTYIKHRARNFVTSRGSTRELRFYAQVQKVTAHDFTFPDNVFSGWEKKAQNDDDFWVRIVEQVLKAPGWYWKRRTHASLTEENYTHRRDLGQPVLAAWVHFLSSKPCLLDTHRQARHPAELYLRTPKTEPLMGLEPFVLPELDTPETKPLLLLLGDSAAPESADKVVARIRALAKAPNPASLVQEVEKWYSLLGRLFFQLDVKGQTLVRQAFRQERLTLTESEEWFRSSDVFQEAARDVFPDAPLVHPAARRLPLWSQVGVPVRPTLESVLEWLMKLPDFKPLDPPIAGRVRAVLGQYAGEVWQTCQRWLSLTNVWTRVDQLRFRVTMQSLTKSSELFPGVRAKTANFQMLSKEVCKRPPFNSLSDLGAVLEYRLTEAPRAVGTLEQEPWLLALAHALTRAKLADESETKHVRTTAARLERSGIQRVDAAAEVRATPYVENEPAGQAQPRQVLWHDDRIFIKGRSLANVFEAVVTELARPFGNDKVTQAIRACSGREAHFVTEYMEAHFDLEEEPWQSAHDEEADEVVGAWQEDGAREVYLNDMHRVDDLDAQPVTEHLEGRGETLAETTDIEQKPRKRYTKRLERYAFGLGYWRDEFGDGFVSADGFNLRRCSPPFHWCRFDDAGNLVTRYWSSPNRLEEGVEIPVEVWEQFQEHPSECCLVLLDEGASIQELPGPKLAHLVKDGTINVYPATYRIRMEMGEVD